MTFRARLGCLAALALLTDACGGGDSGERALSRAETRSALISGGAGRVVVQRARNADYVSVEIDDALVIARFETIARSKEIEAHVRSVYRSGTRVQRRTRVCNLVVYSLADERRTTRAHARRLVRMLADRCR